MKHRYPVVLSLIVGGILILSAGCCIVPQTPLQDPVPVGQGIATEVTTEEVSQWLDDRVEQFQTFRGLGKIGIQTWEERYRFYEIFVLSKPGSFRLETLGALDQPVVFLTSDDMTLSLYSKKHNKFYTGVATRENLFRLSGFLNLSVEDAILVLSGNAPRLFAITSTWGMPLSLETYYLERTSLQDERIQRIWFDTTIQAISKIQEYTLKNGNLVLDVDFKEYLAAEGGYAMPAFILIDRPLENTRVEIEYTRFNVNQAVEPDLFSFTPPANAEKHILENIYGEEFERLGPYEEFRVSN